MVLKQEGSSGNGSGKGDKLGETGLEGYHHGGALGPHSASPTHYLSPSPLECSS
ncbi:hypothetical protein O3M35_013266 [Rhynocoris fuscipes]|uniref:Uncharacterized protein n=1 Tax=Rhynocoris fuscipes TaxID=488301 RepID=A0AAW1CGM3_9HEMI